MCCLREYDVANKIRGSSEMVGKHKSWAALILSVGAFLCNSAFSQSRALGDQDALLLVGPVEARDLRNGLATVLGQQVVLGNLLSPEVGTFTAVYGRLRADGAIIASSIQPGEYYVPGADMVLLTGTVRVEAPSVGHFKVGKVDVDYNTANILSAKQGAVVQLLGTQPLPAGVVLAQKINLVTKIGIIGGGLKPDGIIGGGQPVRDASIGDGKVSADGIIGGGKVSVAKVAEVER